MDPSSVNSSTSDCRTSTAVEPVSSEYLMFCCFRTARRMSRIWVNCYMSDQIHTLGGRSACLGENQDFSLLLGIVLEES